MRFLKARSITCLTASALNSSVYCLLLLINTSTIAMNYGFRVSTKGWPYQGVLRTRPVVVNNDCDAIVC